MNSNDPRLLQLNGPFRNPYEPEIMMWVKSGYMYAVQYPYKMLGIIPATNKDFQDDMFNDEAALKDTVPAMFKNAPVLLKEFFDAMKKNYFFYADMSDTNKKELRYYVYNYFKGSKSKPIDQMHVGTNEVITAAWTSAPIMTTETKENQSDTPGSPVSRAITQMLKDILLSKPVLIGAAIFIGWQIYQARSNKNG